MAADLILHNLKVIASSIGPASKVDFIAIRGNRIVFLGPKTALDDLRGPNTKMRDCRGGIALPGFNDAHCHPIAYAITLRYVDCSAPGVRSIEDIQSILRNVAAESNSERWIRGANLNTSLLAEKRFPTRWELDAVVPYQPVVLVDRTGQCCVLNTIALRLCGIDDRTRSSDAGQISIDEDSDSPSGVICGSNARVANAIPPLTDGELEIGLGAADRTLLSCGITSIQDTSWSNGYRHWQALQTFKGKKLLTPRITMLAGIDALDDFVGHSLKTGAGDESLRLGAIKLALDESTGTDDPPQSELDRLATNAHLAGFQLAFHVPDTNLLRKSLKSLNVVAERTGQRCMRPRFEHCPVCPPTLLPELARSGAIVVSQPNLLYQTGPAYLAEAAEDQLQWIFPYRSYMDWGIGLAFGSDAPLTPCDPLHAIQTAVTRRVEGGAKLCRHESIGLAQALDKYTRAGAYCSNEETIKGMLAPGQLADVIVLDDNGKALAEEKLLQGSVSMTLVDGRVVWTR